MPRKIIGTQLLAVFILGAILILCTKVSQAAAASRPRIVFTSNRTGNNDIFIMNEDGSGVTNLTNDPSDDNTAQWFTDGSRVVFRSNRTGDYEVYTMKSDGTDIVNISNNPSLDDFPVMVSPDGSSIAVKEVAVGVTNIIQGNSYIMKVDGTDKHDLLPSSSVYSGSAYMQGLPIWSPDSQSLILNIIEVDEEGILVFYPSSYRVYRAQADGSGVEPFTSESEYMFKAYAMESPSDGSIVYTGYGIGLDDSGLYIASPDNDYSTSSRLTQVSTTSSDALRDPAYWSPDGTKIIISSNTTGSWEIYTISADGSNRTQLTNFGDFSTQAYWYGSGWGNGDEGSDKIMLNTNKDGNGEIYVINSDGSGLANLTNNSAQDIGGYGGVEPIPSDYTPEPIPKTPKTGKLIGALIISTSLIAIVLVLAKEVKSRHHSWGSER